MAVSVNTCCRGSVKSKYHVSTHSVMLSPNPLQCGIDEDVTESRTGLLQI